MKDIQRLFEQFKNLKVGVVGDVMLDTYMWGAVDRISPEAPVPIVSLQSKEERIGGAGNVALNLQSLGARAFVISVTGEDSEGSPSGERPSPGCGGSFASLRMTRGCHAHSVLSPHPSVLDVSYRLAVTCAIVRRRVSRS